LLWLIWADAGETAPKIPRSLRAQGQAYGELLRNRGFWSYAGCIALSVGVFFCYISGVPLVVETQFGLSPAVAGAAMSAPPLGFMLGNIIAVRIARRVPLARMMMIGRIMTMAGVALAAALWSVGAVPPLGLVLLMSCIGLGNGLTLPAGSAGAMSVRPDLTGAAAGLSGAVMLLTGAAASSATGWALGAFGGGAGMLLTFLTLISAAALLAALPAQRLPGPDAVNI
jgi:DHA1 family bicyclomycin/chloramphenicol resistance-like MFS transporter